MIPGGARRTSYVFLSIAPFVVMPLAAARPLRVPGLYQGIGTIVFAFIAAAVWRLAGRTVDADRRLAVAGALLVAPFAIVALLWIGLGTPWDATPPENVMRYAVLLADAIAVTTGFMLFEKSLSDAGERLHSTLGLSANMLAGAAYLIWLSFQLGAHATQVNRGKIPDSIVAWSDLFDTLLFVACALTYLATAAFAHSMGRVQWLRRVPARAFVALNLILLAFLTIRGLSFPDPTRGDTAWYLRPGFIAGIPAIPWVMPFLLGVIALRRAGEASAEETATIRTFSEVSG